MLFDFLSCILCFYIALVLVLTHYIFWKQVFVNRPSMKTKAWYHWYVHLFTINDGFMNGLMRNHKTQRDAMVESRTSYFGFRTKDWVHDDKDFTLLFMHMPIHGVHTKRFQLQSDVYTTSQ